MSRHLIWVSRIVFSLVSHVSFEAFFQVTLHSTSGDTLCHCWGGKFIFVSCMDVVVTFKKSKDMFVPCFSHYAVHRVLCSYAFEFIRLLANSGTWEAVCWDLIITFTKVNRSRIIHIHQRAACGACGSFCFHIRLWLFLARILEFLMMAAGPDVLLSLCWRCWIQSWGDSEILQLANPSCRSCRSCRSCKQILWGWQGKVEHSCAPAIFKALYIAFWLAAPMFGASVTLKIH